MPGEISRSNPGPRAGAPLIPSWVHDQYPKDHVLDAAGAVCTICGMTKERFGTYAVDKPAAGGS